MNNLVPTYWAAIQSYKVLTQPKAGKPRQMSHRGFGSPGERSPLMEGRLESLRGFCNPAWRTWDWGGRRGQLWMLWWLRRLQAWALRAKWLGYGFVLPSAIGAFLPGYWEDGQCQCSREVVLLGTYVWYFLGDMLQPQISMDLKMSSREPTVIPSRPPREYNGFTRPVMKQITLFSQPVLLIQVLKTNLVSLWAGAEAATVIMITNHASCR